ncbi:MAG: purine phosphoribosyltransferase family protein [Methanomassiliicoccales archaeon]|nr:purine phosphoribosyltransferase family protein [Methanomassiliicoccales archaeon]NYT15718.1 purine phosphoribosyltransferase family protein [Methanomassiliicoccales archaeon]
MLEKLRESLKDSPVVRFGEYDYFIHPVTDGIPFMEPDLLEEVIDHICSVCDFECDLIIGAEAMAIPLMAPLSLKTGVPYNIIRKRRYGLPGEVSVKQVTGYSKLDLYINGISRGNRVVIVDDVISTGGTMRALVTALRGIGARIEDIIIVVEKTDEKAALEQELNVRIKTLVKIEIRDGEVIVLS